MACLNRRIGRETRPHRCDCMSCSRNTGPERFLLASPAVCRYVTGSLPFLPVYVRITDHPDGPWRINATPRHYVVEVARRRRGNVPSGPGFRSGNADVSASHNMSIRLVLGRVAMSSHPYASRRCRAFVMAGASKAEQFGLHRPCGASSLSH